MARRFVLKANQDFAALQVDYARELNPGQLAAATAPEGPVLIVAGAGTGKTRTLVYRVAYLVETGTPPEQIILLTFTRRAAREMLLRASGLLDGRCSQVVGGTFHSYCASLLRRYAPRLGFPFNFTILDASDSADVIDVLRTEKGLHRAENRFPRKTALQSLFSMAANREVDLPDLVASRLPQFIGHTAEIVSLYTAYGQYKHDHGLMDYDDLLRHTLTLCTEHEAIGRRISEGCRHVLVDEYQDTNHVQAQLVQQFVATYGHVTAVGDDAQSIYRFRGADFENIITFPETFPGARIYTLEHNYRSTQPILDLANLLLDRATRKYEKRLFSDRKKGDLPVIVPAPDSRAESRFVAQTVLDLREEGVPLGRIAVLFRNSYTAYDLELELTHRNIPFVKFGGIKLSEAAHIKDVVAYLRVLENPADGPAWNRILQLNEGIGPRIAGQIVPLVTRTGEKPFILPLNTPMPPRIHGRVSVLLELLRTLDATRPPLEEAMGRIVEHYTPLFQQKYPDDHPKRAQDLDHLVTIAAGYGDRGTFLASLALDPIDFSADEAAPETEEEAPLVLTTIHSAKGLEYDSVFIIHALDGVIPSAYAVGDPEALDEELRLLYVAVTRAERNLFISYPAVQHLRGRGLLMSRPSRLLENISEAVLERGEIVQEPVAFSASLN